MDTRTDWQPEVISPDTRGVAPSVDSLLDLLADGERTDALLTERKALVFRGFGLTRESLEKAMPVLLPDRLPYVYGNSPRTKVGENVYTSTEYPQEFTISMHSEMSYAPQWPARLLFFCEKPAESGGATPVVDTARWFRALDPGVREDFSHGLRYTQNLHGGRGFGKSWQETFETSEREDVDSYLQAGGATWHWQNSGGLRITHTRPAVVSHPETGEDLWFNQADQWHPAALGDEAGGALLRTLPSDDLPQSVTFADGSPIPDGHVIQVRDRGLECAVDVDWEAGDLLLVDNLQVAHGRRPFTGTRRVLVAMSD